MQKVSLKKFWEQLRPFCIIAFGLYLLITVFARKLIVEGESMEPNYHNSDNLYVNTITYKVFSPKRYDVVAVHVGSIDYIKRVIGLPGETIWINNNGQVVVNNQVIDDPFAAEYITEERKGLAKDPFTLQKDEYFVMGDNRNNSMDSRTFGSISKKQIIGKVYGGYNKK